MWLWMRTAALAGFAGWVALLVETAGVLEALGFLAVVLFAVTRFAEARQAQQIERQEERARQEHVRLLDEGWSEVTW
uniref:Uncharacterized protein n=1 Tax=Nonomuraea gerenzanensis TaxID=93944 RepID=A0A1M4BL18_9ACTN|nr:hypothetical protein BN4615_P11023 [Nonomuraea gerenzanensis]